MVDSIIYGVEFETGGEIETREETCNRNKQQQGQLSRQGLSSSDSEVGDLIGVGAGEVHGPSRPLSPCSTSASARLGIQDASKRIAPVR